MVIGVITKRFHRRGMISLTTSNTSMQCTWRRIADAYDMT